MYKNNYVTHKYDKNHTSRANCSITETKQASVYTLKNVLRRLASLWFRRMHFHSKQSEMFPLSQKLIISSLLFTLTHTYTQPDTQKKC